MNTTTPARTPEEYAAAYSAGRGCRSCWDKVLLNPKTFYCAECQKTCDEIMDAKNAEQQAWRRSESLRDAARVYVPSNEKSPTYAGIGYDYGESASYFMSDADWQDAVNPHEGDR